MSKQHASTQVSKGRLTEADYERAHKYITQWRDEEGWSDFNLMLSEGDTEMACESIVSSGAIDPECCYEWAKADEELVLRIAKLYEKLSRKEKQKRMDVVFDGCVIFSCNDCNHHSFLNYGNDELYANELKTCWSCNSKNVERKEWGQDE